MDGKGFIGPVRKGIFNGEIIRWDGPAAIPAAFDYQKNTWP